MSLTLNDMNRTSHDELDIERVKEDFPSLQQEVHGNPLVYLDNAATTQKPQRVIDALARYYEKDNSNVHRGVHTLSMRATDEFEGARGKIREFLNAEANEEIIFTRGCTESINLVAQSYGRIHAGEGDEILITHMEHHSNIVPWQILCEQTGAKLRVVPIDDDGQLDLKAFEEMLTERTRIFSVVHLSNALGTINPVKWMIQKAHEHQIPVLVDGAQSVSHLGVDVRDLDADFFTFSGHKVFGPTGIGVLYGKRELLEAMPPYQGGGDMIRSVTFDQTTYNTLPYKFEAGTPHISGAIGLGEALDYVRSIGIERIAAHEAAVLDHATELFQGIDGVRLIGTAREKASVLSFIIEGVHPHDIGTLLDHEGIAIRAGHHCTQPVMQHYNVPATARASFALYNTKEEVDALAEAVRNVREMFNR